jgi:hypothetical protein
LAITPRGCGSRVSRRPFKQYAFEELLTAYGIVDVTVKKSVLIFVGELKDYIAKVLVRRNRRSANWIGRFIKHMIFARRYARLLICIFDCSTNCTEF